MTPNKEQLLAVKVVLAMLINLRKSTNRQDKKDHYTKMIFDLSQEFVPKL